MAENPCNQEINGNNLNTSKRLRNKAYGTGAISQTLKFLSHKQEDLSLRIHIKRQQIYNHTFIMAYTNRKRQVAAYMALWMTKYDKEEFFQTPRWKHNLQLFSKYFYVHMSMQTLPLTRKLLFAIYRDQHRKPQPIINNGSQSQKIVSTTQLTCLRLGVIIEEGMNRL